MDVNTISSLSQKTAALSGSYKKTTTSVTTEAENGKTAAGTMTEAYSLDVSAAAKSAAGAAKALTPEQADVLALAFGQFGGKLNDVIVAVEAT